ncbi:AlbA family DNA-binding domain-containing protein [Tenacibaculum xiamenense]|uniref:AlbA family DNA-binding domain-containing protein n=1 Tax=Tenacibaculum xiamenense TaxID=1261553 RepID=UPI00389585D2
MIEKRIKEITYQDVCELVYVKKVRESETLDYKREFSFNTKEFVKDVTAFANKKGGQIIFGIDEKEMSIIGVSDIKGNIKIEDWISNTFNDLIVDELNYEIIFVPINDDEPPLFIVVLHVYESEIKPLYVNINKKTLCYLRKGTSVFSAKPNEIKRMYEDRSSRQEPITNTKSKSSVKQIAKGRDITQIGNNEGTINITTKKVKKENKISPNPNFHISGEQANQIKEYINQIVDLNSKAGKLKDDKEKGKFYASTWNKFKKKFGVTSYQLLPINKFDEAKNWLQRQLAIQKPKLRRTNNDEWRKRNYKAIWSKSRELNMSKEQIYQMAFERLKLKTPITSLKDLGEQNLDKLYRIMMS